MIARCEELKAFITSVRYSFLPDTRWERGRVEGVLGSLASQRKYRRSVTEVATRWRRCFDRERRGDGTPVDGRMTDEKVVQQIRYEN